MNRTNIEWCDYSWNPVTGCLHGCPYCYARRMAKRFGRAKDLCNCMKHLLAYGNFPKQCKCKINLKIACPGEVFPAGFTPTFYPSRLDEPKKLKKPAKIFTVSMGDLFGEWVPQQWIDAVLQVVRECPQHIFIFLTKNPARYEDYEWPANCWLGTTVESSYTASRLVCMSKIKAAVRFVCFEPLLGPVAKFDLENLKDMHWVIIGAQTGPGAQTPDAEWIQTIIGQAKAYNVPLFLKDNLNWPEALREWPERMKCL